MFDFMRLSLFVLAVCCVWSSAANAQKTVRTDVDYTVLPLSFDSRYGFPTVSVTIQGHSIPLTFDLGGSRLQLAVSPAVLKRLNINVDHVDSVVHGADARGVKSTYKVFLLPEIKLGDFVLNDIKGIEYHPWGGEGAPKNGIVGFNLIARFNVVIDFSHSVVILVRGNGHPPGYDVGSWPKAPFIIDGHMITRAHVNGKAISLIWDTGTPVSSIKQQTIISGDVKKCSKTVLFKVAARPDTCREIAAPEFIMGDRNFGPMTFYTRSMPGLPVDGMIGDDFFKAHVVYIDFANKTVAITNAE